MTSRILLIVTTSYLWIATPASAQNIFGQNPSSVLLPAVVGLAAVNGGGTITTNCTIRGSVTETLGGSNPFPIPLYPRSRRVRYR